MFTSIPGWNVDPITREKLSEVSTQECDLSLLTAYNSYAKKRKASAAPTEAKTTTPDDSARGGLAGAASDKV